MAFLIKSSLMLVVFGLCYRFGLQNEKRFAFNRFYLLSALLLSFSLPFLAFTVPWEEAYLGPMEWQEEQVLVQEAQANAEPIISPAAQQEQPGWNATLIWASIYVLGFLVMAVRFVRNLWSMHKIVASGERQQHQNINLLLTKRPIIPFSFGQLLVIHQADFESGKIDADILAHEATHIKRWHTIDILLVELCLLVYWFNPLLWWYRSLVRSNHEYEADEAATRQHDSIAAYCQKIVAFSSTHQVPSLSSSFSFVQTKKRITMMNKSQSSAWSFGKKIGLAVLVVGTTVGILSMKPKQASAPVISDAAIFTVVIDAGHGGKDPGNVIEGEKVNESSLILALTQALMQLKPQANLRLIHTRQANAFVDLKGRVELARSVDADLLVSIHMNAAENPNVGGMEVFYSEENPEAERSKTYCDAFAQNVQLGSPFRGVKTANFFVLKNAPCPAVMLEVGFVTNKTDLDFINSEDNRHQIAGQILQTLEAISAAY